MRFEPNPLEQPPWSALTTTHAAFSFGNDLARRYRPEFAPMAGVREVSGRCLEALHALMQPGEVVGLFAAEPVAAGNGLDVIDRKSVEQMVYLRNELELPAGAPVPLGVADAPAMLELAELTHPGPFARRTVELGAYIGLRDGGGRLIAMAGERMKFDGFTEISAVCTLPDHRGRGYARLLVLALMRNILARGETAFLHVFSDNVAAAALYEKLGFMHQRSIAVTVLKRPG